MQSDKGTYILTGQTLGQNFHGKPEEDAEAHLLCSNDWMEAHHFDEDIRVQRFCLTLLGEARLWYHSLEPLGDTTWAQLQNLFRQRYSKLGNTCTSSYVMHGDHLHLMRILKL